MARTKIATGAAATGPAHSDSHLPAAVASCPPGMRVLLALGVENALVLVVASTGRVGDIVTVASYATEPLPHFVSHAVHIDACQTRLGPTLYTVCLPWTGVPSGRLVLGCVTSTGRKPLMAVDAVSYASKAHAQLRTLLTPFRSKLVEVFQKVLPRNHVLLELLSSQGGASPVHTTTEADGVQGQFVGVTEGSAEGWVWNQADPSQSYAVEVLHKGQIVGSGAADRYSGELKAQGLGDGCYWFKARLSYELFDGQAHELSVRVVGATSCLPGSPKVETFPENLSFPVPLLSRAEAHSYLPELARRAKVKHPRAIAALARAFTQASLEQETGQPEQARARYQQLKEILGPNAICDVRIAETWLLQHRPGEALAAYEAALASEPDSQIARHSVNALRDREPSGVVNSPSLV